MTLGSSHQTATSQVCINNHVELTLRVTFVKLSIQVLEFLHAHRDTIVILLRIDLDGVPLAVLDEINLVVSICTAVLPLVPKSELVCISRVVTLL